MVRRFRAVWDHPALRTYLDFEKSVAEIETKIEELAALSQASGSEAMAMGVELSRLKTKAERQLADIYAKLDPWQKTQVARHQDRPHFRDYVAALITDFVELSGDRNYGEDAAILGGTGKVPRPALHRARPRERPHHAGAAEAQFRHGPPRGLSQSGAADGSGRAVLACRW